MGCEKCRFDPFLTLIMGGLATFMKAPVRASEMSLSGKYLLWAMSFLGGHTSSDLFDRFSKLGKDTVMKKS